MKNLTLPLTILFLLTVVYSCTSEDSYIQVDFSETISAPKPQSQFKNSKDLRVAVAAIISPKETFKYYQDILNYLGQKIGSDIHLVQRKTYNEINEMFPKNEVDLAFICSGPYALEKQQYNFQAIVTPVVRGSPFYQSYLIVNKNSSFQSLKDLRNHTFAFSDPDSNTGTLVPKYWLWQLGETSESFFSQTKYTYSHDNSILTVAKSLVAGAAVDGHIWEFYQKTNNVYTSQTRIIKKSENFGSPPLVASTLLPKQLKERIQSILFTMHDDFEGKKILDHLLIDRFIEPQEEWYKPISEMREKLLSNTEI